MASMKDGLKSLKTETHGCFAAKISRLNQVATGNDIHQICIWLSGHFIFLFFLLL